MILSSHASRVTHLLRRTGFRATKEQVDAAVGYTIPQIVDSLLDAATPPVIPSTGSDPNPPEQFKSLSLWWIDHMCHTTNPLLERMTLFWHGHFTSAYHKVKDAELMATQNTLLRQHALGNFRTLAYEISIDNAMLIWLDNTDNNKETPNENFARESLELFLLGIGNYTEQDVKETARAFTGYKANKLAGVFTFAPNQHDNDPKTILGKTANFDMKSTLDWLIAQPACATFITTKLWKFFVSPDPDPYYIEKLSAEFIRSGYSIKALLKALLCSNAFYADNAYRNLIKSPTEYVVSILAIFPRLRATEHRSILTSLTLMGQVLIDPSNVSGWPSGAAWLNSSMMFARFNFAEWAVSQVMMSDFPIPTMATASELLTNILDRIGMGPLSYETKTELINYINLTGMVNKDTILRGVLHLLFISPEFQTL